MRVENKGFLLSIMELGGYPNMQPLYEKLGYNVETVTSMRKALRVIKQKSPSVIVAEFNFQSDFRDRTSSLETLMAVVQQQSGTRVIVFYEKEYLHQFEKIKGRFDFYATLYYPIDEELLSRKLEEI